MTDPKDIHYPATPDERFTYARLKLQHGQRSLTDLDVERILKARRKRELKRKDL